MLTEKMVAELRAIEKKGRGELKTEDVVAVAKNPKSELHKHPAFEWDVSKAAERQWFEAARHVVQVYVGIVNDGKDRKVMRQYVHIRDADNLPVYKATQRVLLENRATLVNLVCDRIMSAINSYPLREFDPVVDLVQHIRIEKGGDQQAA
jgi:beta-N-acetylglucosaminidase